MWEIQKKQTERGNVIVEKTYLPNTISGPCLDPSSNKVPIKGDSFFFKTNLEIRTWLWVSNGSKELPLILQCDNACSLCVFTNTVKDTY